MDGVGWMGSLRKSDSASVSSALGLFMSDIIVNETKVSQVGQFKAAPPQQQQQQPPESARKCRLGVSASTGQPVADGTYISNLRKQLPHYHVADVADEPTADATDNYALSARSRRTSLKLLGRTRREMVRLRASYGCWDFSMDNPVSTLSPFL